MLLNIGLFLINISFVFLSVLFKGHEKLIHFTQFLIVRMVKKNAVRKENENKYIQSFFMKKNINGYPHTIIKPAISIDFSIKFMGPGRKRHNFGAPELAQQLSIIFEFS